MIFLDWNIFLAVWGCFWHSPPAGHISFLQNYLDTFLTRSNFDVHRFFSVHLKKEMILFVLIWNSVVLSNWCIIGLVIIFFEYFILVFSQIRTSWLRYRPAQGGRSLWCWPPGLRRTGWWCRSWGRDRRCSPRRWCSEEKIWPDCSRPENKEKSYY